MVNVVGRANPFPLKVSPDKRYFVGANGRPFLIIGDAAWSLEVQLTRQQIEIYLNDRQAKGYTAVVFECMEHRFSSNTPIWQNAEGNIPFITMTASSATFESQVNAYWQLVDYVVNTCLARGLLCLIFPAYLGFNGGAGLATDEGWNGAVQAASSGNLQSYGAFLGARYTQPNIFWGEGGDYAGTTGERDQAHNIATGIQSVQPNAKFVGHPSRGQSAYALWGPGGQNYNYGGNFIGSTYCATDGADAYSLAATEYARPGPIPFIQLEDGYEGTHTLTEFRRSKYGVMLSGGCGFFGGNNPLWSFGDPNGGDGLGSAHALSLDLDTAGAQQVGYLASLLRSYAWWRMVPKTDASLVTSPGLGTGTGRIVPALSSDASFAMIFTPGATVTVDMTNFAQSSVRGRWFDPALGTYAAAGGSPYANTGAQAFAPPGGGTLVLVLD